MRNLVLSKSSSANALAEAVSSNEIAHNRIFYEHALLNNLVVQRTFKFLATSADLNTLKNIRLVCSVWRDESLSWWRKTAIFNLNPDRTFKTSESSVVPTATRGNIYCTIQQPSESELFRINDKPFLKYKLEVIPVDVPNTYTNELWRVVGPNVKHFTFRNVTLFNEERIWTSKSIEDFPRFLKRQMPNLEKLELDNIRLYNVDLDSYYQALRNEAPLQYQLTSVLYLKIKGNSPLTLSSLPNLEYLVLEDLEFPLLYRLILTIKILTFCKIKRIDLCWSTENWNITNINVIRGMYLCKLPKLQHFTVNMLKTRPRSPDIYLYTFLNTHREGLEVLEMFDFPFLEPYSSILCNHLFEKLTELRLWGSIVRNLEFLKFTPNLKVLHMDVFGLERQDELKKEMNRWVNKRNKIWGVNVAQMMNCGLAGAVVVPKLEYLQINSIFSLQQLQILGMWMPNLKTFKTILGQGSISVISAQWPFLEELVGLQGSIIQDEDVMTFSSACLRNLENLKVFHLNACCDEGLLTDLSAEMGFLQMAKLKDLRICVSPQFSKEMERRLNKKIPMVHITRNYTENKEHANWKCCRDLEFVHYVRDKLPNIVWG